MKRLGFGKIGATQSLDLSGVYAKIDELDSAYKNSDSLLGERISNLVMAQNSLNSRFSNLVVGGRNLILGSQVSRDTHGSTLLKVSPSIDYALLSQLTLSVDIRYQNARRAVGSDVKWFRVGAEIRLRYTDGSFQYVGNFQMLSDTPSSYNGRRVVKFTVPSGKVVREIDVVQIQIWDVVADEIVVKNPKLELFHVATDWSPAPEDLR